MNIFGAAKKFTDAFFDGLKENAQDKVLQEAKNRAYLELFKKGEELIQKAKENKLDEAQIEKFKNGLEGFSQKSPGSSSDLRNFVNYFRDYVDGEIHLQKLLNDDSMFVSESDKKIEQVAEYYLSKYANLSEHFIPAMKIVMLKDFHPTLHRLDLKIEDWSEAFKVRDQLEAAGVTTAYDINPFDSDQKKYRANLKGHENFEAILLLIEKKSKNSSEDSKNNKLLEEIKSKTESTGSIEDIDELFKEAAKIVVLHQEGSASLLQRKLKIGYNRAGLIIDQLFNAGIVGPSQGSAARDVKIIEEEELDRIFDELDV